MKVVEANKMRLDFLLSGGPVVSVPTVPAAASRAGPFLPSAPPSHADSGDEHAVLPGSPVSQRAQVDSPQPFVLPLFVRGIPPAHEPPADARTPPCDDTPHRPFTPERSSLRVPPALESASCPLHAPYRAAGRLSSWPASLPTSDVCSSENDSPVSVRRPCATQRHPPGVLPSRLPLPQTSLRRAGVRKTHVCFCGRAFNKREHLKRHNLLVHQEVRPFTCEECELHFGTKQNHQVHLSTRKHRQRVAFKQARANGLACMPTD
jgi:hypothetical protein